MNFWNFSMVDMKWSWIDQAVDWITRLVTVKRSTLVRFTVARIRPFYFFFFFPTSGRCTCNEDRNPTRKRNKHSVTGKDAPSNPLKLIRPRFPVAGKGAASSNRECHLDEFHTSWSRMSQVRRTLLFGVWKYVFHPIQITFHRCHARFPLLTLGFIIAYSKLFGIGWCKNLYIIEWWLWVFCLIFCFSY